MAAKRTLGLDLQHLAFAPPASAASGERNEANQRIATGQQARFQFVTTPQCETSSHQRYSTARGFRPGGDGVRGAHNARERPRARHVVLPQHTNTHRTSQESVRASPQGPARRPATMDGRRTTTSDVSIQFRKSPQGERGQTYHGQAEAGHNHDRPECPNRAAYRGSEQNSRKQNIPNKIQQKWQTENNN